MFRKPHAPALMPATLAYLASAFHRSAALIAAVHRLSAGCPRCNAFPTSQIARNALDRASSTSNRASWSP